MAIFTAFIPVILQILGYFISLYFKGKAAETFYLQMINQLEMGGVKSVRLNDDYRRQIEYIRENELWPKDEPEKEA